MAKEIELTGQSYKSLRAAYSMKYKEFKKSIAPIQKKLDKMTTKENYRNLLPKQVKLIIELLGQP